MPPNLTYSCSQKGSNLATARQPQHSHIPCQKGIIKPEYEKPEEILEADPPENMTPHNPARMLGDDEH